MNTIIIITLSLQDVVIFTGGKMNAKEMLFELRNVIGNGENIKDVCFIMKKNNVRRIFHTNEMVPSARVLLRNTLNFDLYHDVLFEFMELNGSYYYLLFKQNGRTLHF